MRSAIDVNCIQEQLILISYMDEIKGQRGCGKYTDWQSSNCLIEAVFMAELSLILILLRCGWDPGTTNPFGTMWMWELHCLAEAVFKAEYNLYTIRPQCAERPWKLLLYVHLYHHQQSINSMRHFKKQIWRNVKRTTFQNSLYQWLKLSKEMKTIWSLTGSEKAGVQIPVLTYSLDPLL